MINRFTIPYTYKRETDLWVLNLETVELPIDFEIVERSIVAIPPKQTGGNHTHPRQEVFIELGEGLELHWRDETGIKHIVSLDSAGGLTAFLIPPNIPHAVYNSGNMNAYLIEFADGVQRDIKPSKVI